MREIFSRVADSTYGVDHPFKLDDVHKLRRTVKDRTTDAWREATELATIAELYESELRALGLVDYEDMVLYGERLVQEHDWVLPLIRRNFRFSLSTNIRT